MKNVGIIIPIAPDENSWEKLWIDLKFLPDDVKIFLVGTKKPTTEIPNKIRWIQSDLGRANQMNKGAEIANCEFLWFLHADSRFSSNTFKSLTEALTKNPNNLYYFDLEFLNDGPWLMFINAIGANIRSHLLGIPFGDQGLFLSKKNFDLIGGFPNDVPYGEDHVFVWRARQNGITVSPANSVIKTSARKYQERGWLKVTLLHLWLTIKQAWPERQKLKSNTRSKNIH